MWKTAYSVRYSPLWALRLAGWQSGSMTPPVLPITSGSLPSAIPSAPPLMPPPPRQSVSTMLVRLSYAISVRNWMSSDPGSTEQNEDCLERERTAADVARGLEEVVRLNRAQFEAFAAIRRDIEDLTERIKSGNLLLLPRSPHPRKRTRP
jgi:hypothetical protein